MSNIEKKFTVPAKLYADDPEIRPLLFEGQIGLELETHRIDRKGHLAQTPHPFDEEAYIDRDFGEAQIEINTPPVSGADVADASELEHGTLSTGLIFSSSSMAQKAGGALGGFLLLMILAYAGYDKDLAIQGAGTLRAIKALMSFIPAIGAVLGAACLCFYPYTTQRMKEIQEALKKQREER